MNELNIEYAVSQLNIIFDTIPMTYVFVSCNGEQTIDEFKQLHIDIYIYSLVNATF